MNERLSSGGKLLQRYDVTYTQYVPCGLLSKVQIGNLGLPGSGKTEMARQWIYETFVKEAKSTNCHKIECTVSGNDSIKSSLKSFLSAVGETVVDEKEPNDLVRAVFDKLISVSAKDPTDWLIMFDDLREEHKILDVISSLADHLKKNRIRVVVTTRQQPRTFKGFDKDSFGFVEVPCALDRSDAKGFLQKKTDGEYTDSMIVEIEQKIRLLPLHLQLFTCLLNEDEVSLTRFFNFNCPIMAQLVFSYILHVIQIVVSSTPFSPCISAD